MRQIVIILSLFTGCFATSQNKQIIYGMSEIPQSLMVNPGGVVPQDMHIGIPFLSQLHINAGSSGVTVYDIFQSSDTSINDRITTAIFQMDNADFFTVTQQLELINIGWRSKWDYYFSGGMYQELDMITYFPKDLAILGWEGNREYLDYEFDLGEINTSGDLLTVYHFGANKKVSDRLTLGVRAKVYSSIFNYRSTDNRGTFVTRLGDGSQNIYDHVLEDAHVSVQTSGIGSLIDNENVNNANDVMRHALGRAFFGGNLGVGMDVGANYDITNRLTASASILDFGTIFHSNDVENYRASGSYTLTGINLIFPPLNDGDNALPYYENLEDEITEQVPVDTLYNSYSTMRPLKVNAGLVYTFGKLINLDDCNCLVRANNAKGEQSVGLQFYSLFRPKTPQMAATLFYYRRFADFLSGKVTYTVDTYGTDNVGLGLVGDFNTFNVYIAADNLLRYGNIAKANSVSLQLGFNLKFDSQ